PCPRHGRPDAARVPPTGGRRSGVGTERDIRRCRSTALRLGRPRRRGFPRFPAERHNPCFVNLLTLPRRRAASRPRQSCRHMPQTALNNTRFIAIFLAIIVLGLALSSMTWVRGQRVDALTTSLVNGDVPAFDGLANRKIAVIGEQLSLFQYYATLDRDSFREEYESRRGEIAEGLELLARAFPEDAVAADVSRRFRAI